MLSAKRKAHIKHNADRHTISEVNLPLHVVVVKSYTSRRITSIVAQLKRFVKS